MKLDAILHLSPKIKQVVKRITRVNPLKMLDPIVTTLAPYYQMPEILPTLDADYDSGGSN